MDRGDVGDGCEPGGEIERSECLVGDIQPKVEVRIVILRPGRERPEQEQPDDLRAGLRASPDSVEKRSLSAGSVAPGDGSGNPAPRSGH
jgi:hypothetical protein